MLRTVLFWLHLTAGVIAGAIILLMSVTGVLLTYEKQLAHWADLRQLPAIDAPVSVRLSPDSLVTLAQAANGGKTPSAITLRSDPREPALVAFGRDGNLFLNPGSGAVLGTGSPATHEFFGDVEDWHRWMAGTDENRKRLKSVTGAANLMFLLLVLTGMVLWLPRTWSWIKVRAVVWFRGGLSGKARDFNWHNALGIWSALPLIAIVASGSVIGYPWAGDLVYRVVGETPPPRTPPGGRGAVAGAGAGALLFTGTRMAAGAPTGAVSAAAAGGSGRGADRLDAARKQGVDTPIAQPTYAAMIATAAALMPEWRATTLQIPKPGAKTTSVTLDRGTGGQPQHRATVQFSSATGELARYQPFDSLSNGRQLRSVLRFTHTGEVLGLFGQTWAGLVSLASVVLVMTGIALSIRRAARALARRSARSSAPVSSPTT